MKVLMVVSWYSSKDAPVLTAGVFHYEQAVALKPYCETALYYPYDETLTEPFSCKEERGLLTYRRRLSKGIPKLTSVLQRLNMMADLKRICREFQPDVIHAHCAIPAGRMVAMFGKKYGYPVVITEHNPLEHFRLDDPKVKSSIAYAYSNSGANICVSGDSMSKLKHHFPQCDFRVIYNGILSPEKLEMDKECYRVEGKINCCIVAAFYSKDIKGYQHLIPAMAQLKQAGMPVALHIVGGGDYYEYYVNLAKELDVEDVCIFHGSCNKAKVYSVVVQMDFGISASLYESAGVSVEEALLLGKPMLVTRSGGANSLVTEDVAIVVDKGSTQALVEGITQMAQRLKSFDSDAIKAYATQRFEIDQVSRQHMALYERLLTEGRKDG